MFTQKQLNDFRAYREVQESGKYNMLDPRARQLAGLDREDFLFVLSNYSALKQAYEAAEDQHILEMAERHGH